ncbi:hypothetical protein [Novosphingobium sp. JCM 18896]|uniref:hypothetical protein n=1 Tax=Novosphingobium sp. JCM 18896 TaxID=2989731 RepID=UPI002222735E|nr:hypothetical protein [Novosphingobium sp. JCM 18896]MCW1431399.1 hypothetical protein [Novosphingobium sp. JCM 18896]
MTRSYVARNRDKANAYQREYAARQSDHKRRTAELWRKNNPERCKELARIRTEKQQATGWAELNARRRADPKFRIDNRMSVNIGAALKGRKAGRRWESLVGYTLDDLVAHLEALFLPGMTWDNIGEWHIDHVRPKSSFSYLSPDEAEFRECWSMANLQPLWASDNLSKHTKLDWQRQA